MFLPRMLVGLLVFLNVVVVCGQESPSATPPEVPAKAAPAKEKDASAPESATPDSTLRAIDNIGVSVATPEQLQQWIKNLGHQRFATRQAASQKLVQAGVAGMQAAAKAAKTEDLELATRCLAVLTEGLTSKDEKVRSSAKSALETLAKSDNRSVAQRARQALDTPRGLPEFPGALGPGIGRNFQQIRVQVVNGVREITVTQNGKVVVLKDFNGKDISVAVTTTVNGKQVTETFTGKDEEDLKKNHPEAHALFEKYGKGNANGGVQIRIGGNAFGNIFVPVPRQQMRPRILNPIKAADLFEEIDQLRRKLEESNGRLMKAASSDKPDPAELKKISEEIKTTIRRLAEIKTESQLP